MNVVIIDAEVFGMMMGRLEKLGQTVESLCTLIQDAGERKWLDNDEVCEIFNISKRVLQTMRNEGRVPYAKIGGKVFYRPQDIAKLIDQALVEPEK